ncbi:MAG: hypothetical protein ACO26C_06710 [Ilumatobacteraceae bacterium]
MYEEINIQAPYTAAGTASRGQWGWTVPNGLRIDTSTIRLVPDTSVTTDGTNYTTYTLSRYRSGSATTIATFTTNSSGGAALTQWTPAAMTLDAGATGTKLDIVQYDTLVLTKAESGSGKNGGAIVMLMATADRQGA